MEEEEEVAEGGQRRKEDRSREPGGLAGTTSRNPKFPTR